MSQSQSGSGIGGLATLLFVAFLVLKLTHVIAWSWLWVFAPLWIPFAVAAVILLIVGLVALADSK